MTDTVRTFRIDHDLFFISRAFYDLYKQRLARCLLLPIDEFLAHSSYNTVHSASNHSLWEIACDDVIVAEEGWYEQLEATFQQALFTETTKCGSTLIDGSKPITIRYWKGLAHNSRPPSSEGMTTCRENFRWTALAGTHT